MQAQLDGLESKGDELSEARRREEEANAKRASSEALLRRLDNERAYLRSQLTSEVLSGGHVARHHSPLLTIARQHSAAMFIPNNAPPPSIPRYLP